MPDNARQRVFRHGIQTPQPARREREGKIRCRALHSCAFFTQWTLFFVWPVLEFVFPLFGHKRSALAGETGR